MDSLSSFSSPDFDVKKWINGLIPQDLSSEASHQQISSLRMKLQILSVEVGHSLDDLSSQSVSRLPKAMRDVDLIKKKATELKKTISLFETQIASLEDDTSTSMSALKNLDHAKKNMEQYYSIIRETEKLKQMLTQIDQVFKGNDYKKMASTLQEMRQSYRLVKDIPQLKQETNSLDIYEQDLISNVSLALKDAILEHKTTDAQDCIYILEQSGNLEKASNVYEEALKLKATRVWTKFDSLTALDQLNGFYEDILSNIHTEISWSQKIFKTPMTSLIFVSYLEAVHKGLSQKDMTYEEILSLHKRTVEFSERIKTSLSSLALSERSMILYSLYQPYLSTVQEFHHIEKARLLKSLTPIKPKYGDFSETIRNLKDSIPTLFKLLDESVRRCLQFTLGTQIENMMNVLSSALVEYLVHLAKSLKSLRSRTGLDEIEKSDFVNKKTVPQGLENEEWKESYLQGSIQFLEGILEFKNRLESFTIRLKQQILTKSKDLFVGDLELTDIGSAYFYNNITKSKRLSAFIYKVQEDGKIFPSVEGVFESLVNQSKLFVVDITLSFIKGKFDNLHTLSEWTKDVGRTDILQFSLSPNLYIKQIVEHLLTLPQLLEPYEENKLLKMVDFRPLRTSNKLSPESSLEWSHDAGFSNSLISVVASETQSLFVKSIEKITTLSPLGKEQLNTDISHLFNVLDVFGLTTDDKLVQLQQTLVEKKNDV